MIKVKLNYVECRHSGEHGLLIDGSHDRLYAATDGVLVAHDIIEQINAVSDIGSVIDELEALAALWWIRGEFNDLRRDNYYQAGGSALSPYEHLAYDISLMAEHIGNGVASVPKVLKTQSCCYDDDFNLIIEIARKKYRQTMLDDIHTDIFRGVSDVNRYFDTVIHYMRKGYRKAVNRYKKLGQMGTNTLFWKLAFAIDTDFQVIDIGDSLEVCYSLTTGEVKTDIQRRFYD